MWETVSPAACRHLGDALRYLRRRQATGLNKSLANKMPEIRIVTILVKKRDQIRASIRLYEKKLTQALGGPSTRHARCPAVSGPAKRTSMCCSEARFGLLPCRRDDASPPAKGLRYDRSGKTVVRRSAARPRFPVDSWHICSLTLFVCACRRGRGRARKCGGGGVANRARSNLRRCASFLDLRLGSYLQTLDVQ
jgi:hypothetical protein